MGKLDGAMEKRAVLYKAAPLRRKIVYKHAAPRPSLRGMDIVERDGSILACRQRSRFVGMDDNSEESVASVQVLAEGDDT